jgi:hypothetical protein
LHRIHHRWQNWSGRLPKKTKIPIKQRTREAAIVIAAALYTRRVWTNVDQNPVLLRRDLGFFIPSSGHQKLSIVWVPSGPQWVVVVGSEKDQRQKQLKTVQNPAISRHFL